MEQLKRNDYLAVMGDDGTFWLCKVLLNTKPSTKNPNFKAVWLETNDGLIYKISEEPNYVPFKAILRKVRLSRTDERDHYKLPNKTKAILEKIMKCSKYGPRNISKIRNSDATEISRSEPRPKKVKKNIIKVQKQKIDKSNPNWRLKSRPVVLYLTKRSTYICSINWASNLKLKFSCGLYGLETTCLCLKSV